jgi:hypothetical protein
MTENYIYLPISIGCIVFLIQQTDFIYEYTSMFSNLFRIKYLQNKFKTYENSNNYENYISFVGSVHGVKKNITGFICRLATCFICLNCFLSLFSVLLITKSIILALPCFFFSVLVFYILFIIKKHVFS